MGIHGAGMDGAAGRGECTGSAGAEAGRAVLSEGCQDMPGRRKRPRGARIWMAATVGAGHHVVPFSNRQRRDHSSRFSFRRPQCLSFEESYPGIIFAPCNASIIPT